jgi:MarR family transcriptional regulator, 2-MHQ and catechol-resistance regulon repressor
VALRPRQGDFEDPVTKATSSDISATHVWLVMMKAHRTLQRHAVRSIEALDMCLSDFAILELLLHKGPQKVNEIGRRIDLTSGSITTAVDRLAARKLVERVLEPNDRRARIVRLTRQGKSRISEVFAVHTTAMGRAAGALTKSERATLVQLLKKLGTTAEARLTKGMDDHD